jgi:hemerythrin-like domain-containing protein
MSSVLLAVRTIARRALRADRAPDFQVLTPLLKYLGRFSEGLHQTNEEKLLFQPLHGQPDLMRTLARLRRDHSAMKGYGNRLRTAAGYWQQGDPRAGQQVAIVADDYVRFCRRHAREEQELLLQAGLRTFSAYDWAKLNESFAAVDDPLLCSKSHGDCAAALKSFA